MIGVVTHGALGVSVVLVAVAWTHDSCMTQDPAAPIATCYTEKCNSLFSKFHHDQRDHSDRTRKVDLGIVSKGSGSSYPRKTGAGDGIFG